MTTLTVRDAIKRSIESASNGKQTVIFTTKGQPCIMNIIPKFDMSTVDATLSGTHPAFIVNGVEVSRILIGTYEGALKNGELVSQAYVAPEGRQTPDELTSYARANGPGFHLMTNAEWAMLQLLAVKNGYNPFGNTMFGNTDGVGADYTGVNVNGYPAGDGRAGLIFTGSGPIQYRYDGTFTGISDLVGNAYEPVLGLRIVSGEIQVIPNNNAAMTSTNLSAASTEWKAIDGSNGAFITPTFTGTLAEFNYVATTPKSVRIALDSTEPYTLSTGATALGGYAPFTGMLNKGITPVSSIAIKILKALGIFPLTPTLQGNDGIQIGVANVGTLNGYEYTAWRGGYYWEAPNQGLNSLLLCYGRTSQNNSSGRIAYYDA